MDDLAFREVTIDAPEFGQGALRNRLAFHHGAILLEKAQDSFFRHQTDGGAVYEHGVVNALPANIPEERRRCGAEPCAAGPSHGQLGEPFPNGVTDRQPEDEDLRGVTRHGRVTVETVGLQVAAHGLGLSAEGAIDHVQRHSRIGFEPKQHRVVVPN